MRKTNSLLVLALVATVGTNASVARAETPVEAADLYRQWYDLRQDHPDAALPIAHRYLEAFPSADNADFLRRWIADVRARAYASAKKTHDIDRLVALTREARGAGGAPALDYLAFTAFEIRERELFHNPPIYVHASAAAAFARAATELIDAGTVPTAVAKGTFDRDKTLALLAQTIALASRVSDPAVAAEYFGRAARLEPSNPVDHFELARILREAFDRDFEHWREVAAAGPAESAAGARRVAERSADALLEQWRLFLESSKHRADLAAHRAQVLDNLRQVYRFRHPDAEAELDRVVATLQ